MRHQILTLDSPVSMPGSSDGTGISLWSSPVDSPIAGDNQDDNLLSKRSEMECGMKQSPLLSSGVGTVLKRSFSPQGLTRVPNAHAVAFMDGWWRDASCSGLCYWSTVLDTWMCSMSIASTVGIPREPAWRSSSLSELWMRKSSVQISPLLWTHQMLLGKPLSSASASHLQYGNNNMSAP